MTTTRPRRRRRPPASPTAAEAARFLAQASMGASRAQIDQVQAIGYDAWLDAQFAMPRRDRALGLAGRRRLRTPRRQEQPGRLRSGDVAPAASPARQAAPARRHGAARFPRRRHRRGQRPLAAVRRRRLCRPARQRAFGNFRTLLQQISTNVAMGDYLTFAGNRKANPATGAVPDENYARELMQLFTIGLLQLNTDGTRRRPARRAGRDLHPGRHYRPRPRLHRLELSTNADNSDARPDARCRWPTSPASTRPASRPSSAPRSRPAPTARSSLRTRARRDLRPSERAAVRLQAADPAPRHLQSVAGLCRPRSRRCSPTTAAACAAT